MNRADFQQLANLRIAEAGALLTLPVPMPDGVYYLAGYSVECALKACIAKGYGPEEWPDKKFVADCHSHEILSLVRLAGLEGARTADVVANPSLGTNWSVVKDWSERSRYERHSLAKAGLSKGWGCGDFRLRMFCTASAPDMSSCPGEANAACCRQKGCKSTTEQEQNHSFENSCQYRLFDSPG